MRECKEKIKNVEELEFAVFCIENVANRLGMDGRRIYDACILKGANRYECESYIIAKKYVRVIERFSERMDIFFDDSLEFFYHSDLYQLVRAGISDMHCMSDEYLAEELEIEYKAKNNQIS